MWNYGCSPGGGVTGGLTLQEHIIDVEGGEGMWLPRDLWRLFDCCGSEEHKINISRR